MSSFIRPITMPTRAIAVAALLGTTVLAGSLAVPHAAAAPLQLAQATAPQTTPPTPAIPPTKQAVPEVQAAPAGQPGPSTPATPQTQQSDTAAETKPETVDQRITSLHEALQITPQQQAKWDRVAQVMRDNAAAMQKLVAERDAADNITAVQDLREYEKFAQAHVTGLRKLTVAFDTLYNAMPAAQQKVADQVFANFGHHKADAAAAHS